MVRPQCQNNDAVPDLKFKTLFMPSVSIVEFHLVRDILYGLMDYDDRRLTEMVYRSKPVRREGVFAPGEPGAAGQILNFNTPGQLI